MQLILSGRISKMVRLDNGNFQTLIQTPAPDQYSQPSTYKVSSPAQLGQPGDELKLTCSVRGFVRFKNYDDKQTGVKKQFWDANVIFDVTHSEPLKSAPSVRAAS